MAESRVIEAGGAPFASVRRGKGALFAVAVHAGHELRPGLEGYLALDETERLREEDPGTEDMAPEGATLLAVVRSRFEVDCNRPRSRCVYQGPQDAWGLTVYRGELPDEEDRRSRAVYDSFYAAMFDEISRLVERHERVVLLDLHAYNHRRSGPDGVPADSEGNPEVNLGTARIDRARWAPVVDAFALGMTSAGFDVRENVKFGGGHLAHWVTEHFAEKVCPLATEFKKTYMDEWTGEVDMQHVARIRGALAAIAEPLVRSLAEVR